MKPDTLLWLAVSVVCLPLYGCGHDSSAAMTLPPPASMTPPPPPPPMQPTPMEYSTADVLAKARVMSETDDPFAVNGGVVVLNPSDDQSSDPLAIDPN